jgi:hypothetical protein
MKWHEIREKYPDQWLIVEALEAHTEGQQRLLDQITGVQLCADGAAALQEYCHLH